MIRKNIIAVDFDGTLCEHKFPKIGEIKEVNQNVIDYIKARKELHDDIIILWTCREGSYLDDAVKWCKKNEIPIDYVNDNCDDVKNSYGQSRKILADIYIDDKAINVSNFK